MLPLAPRSAGSLNSRDELSRLANFSSRLCRKFLTKVISDLGMAPSLARFVGPGRAAERLDITRLGIEYNPHLLFFFCASALATRKSEGSCWVVGTFDLDGLAVIILYSDEVITWRFHALAAAGIEATMTDIPASTRLFQGSQCEVIGAC